MKKGTKRARAYARADRYQRQMARSLDELDELLQLKEAVLPNIRKDLAAGLSAEEIYAKYKPLVAARNVTIALTEVDSGKALTAGKEVLDRSDGKATEKKTVTHKYERMKDEDLDALLTSKLMEAGVAPEDEKH